MAKQLQARVFISPKDLMPLYGHKSYKGAWKAYQALKDALGKKQHQRITVTELATYEGISPAEILAAL